jgi:hypothetical protein
MADYGSGGWGFEPIRGPRRVVIARSLGGGGITLPNFNPTKTPGYGHASYLGRSDQSSRRALRPTSRLGATRSRDRRA